MVRWMCDVEVKDEFQVELREERETYWVKKCIEYEAEDSRPTGRPKRIWI